MYVRVPQMDDATGNSDKAMETGLEDTHLLTIWKHQFLDALRVLHLIILVCLLRLNVDIIDSRITTTTTKTKP